MATSGEAIDQVASDGALECVSDSDGERGGESTGGGEVHEKSAGQDGGPTAVAEKPEGGGGDTGAGAKGCGAGVYKRQSYPEVPRHEITSGQGPPGKELLWTSTAG